MQKNYPFTTKTREMCDTATPAIRCTHTSTHRLALSNNLASSLLLPPPVAPVLLRICLQSAYLRRRLTKLVEDVIMDNTALIEEGHLPQGRDGCITGITDEKVFDACWLRELPLGRFAAIGGRGDGGSGREEEEEARAARRVLTNHLQMMEAVISAWRCSPSPMGGGGAALNANV